MLSNNMVLAATPEFVSLKFTTFEHVKSKSTHGHGGYILLISRHLTTPATLFGSLFVQFDILILSRTGYTAP